MGRAKKIDRKMLYDDFDDDDNLYLIHPVPSTPAVEVKRELAGNLYRYQNPRNDREILLCEGCRRASRPTGFIVQGKAESGQCRGCRGVKDAV